MRKSILSILMASLLFLTGCGGIAGKPISELILITIIPALIFYLISIVFVGLGILIKKFVSSKINFQKHKLSVSIILSIFVFLIFNSLLLLIDPDMAVIFFYLVLQCSFAIFLGMYNKKFWMNGLYLLIAISLLVFIFVIDVHGPLILYKLFKIF